MRSSFLSAVVLKNILSIISHTVIRIASLFPLFPLCAGHPDHSVDETIVLFMSSYSTLSISPRA
jgi:hypothetical protein